MSPGTDRNAVAEARIADPVVLSRYVILGMSVTEWSPIGDGCTGTELSQHFVERAWHPDDGPAESLLNMSRSMTHPGYAL